LRETIAVWSWKSTHYHDESQKLSQDILLAGTGHFGYNHSLLVFGQIAWTSVLVSHKPDKHGLSELISIL
jgi:hypothetical protein